MPYGMLALLGSLKPLQKGGTLGNSADLSGRLQFPSPSPILQSLQSRSCGAYVRGKKGQKPLAEYMSFARIRARAMTKLVSNEAAPKGEHQI
jgi:hypothetical protein